MNLKFIASSAGFLGVGAALGWAITADRAEKKFRHIAEDFVALQDALREKTRENIELRYEVNDKKEEIENLHAAVDQETGFAEDENSPEDDSIEIDSGGEIDQLPSHQEPTDEEIAEERSHLQRLIDQYVPSQETVEEFAERPVIASTKYDPPFVIPQEQYAWSEEGDNYAKITLKYYAKHHVLLDEEEEPIDDVEGYVGWRALNRFGDESGNPDVVYVRNRRLETDFEVERETEEDLPLHVKYAMPRMEFVSQRAAGKLRIPEEDG